MKQYIKDHYPIILTAASSLVAMGGPILAFTSEQLWGWDISVYHAGIACFPAGMFALMLSAFLANR